MGKCRIRFASLPKNRERERAFTSPNPELGGSHAKMSSGKVLGGGDSIDHKSVLRPLRHFLESQKSRGEPVGARGVASVLIFPDRRRTAIMEKYDESVEKCIIENSKSKAKNPPKFHLYNNVSACRKFGRIAGISYLSHLDIDILLIEAKD